MGSGWRAACWSPGRGERKGQLEGPGPKAGGCREKPRGSGCTHGRLAKSWWSRPPHPVFRIKPREASVWDAQFSHLGIPSALRTHRAGQQTPSTWWASQPSQELLPSPAQPLAETSWPRSGDRSGPASVLASCPLSTGKASLPGSWTPHLGNSASYSDEKASVVGFFAV